ncbi:hypothetical protein D3C80_1954320 [compost metagenome]
MGAGAAGDVAALFPERIVMGAVEGDQQQLFRPGRLLGGLRFGERRRGEEEGETKGGKGTRHR